MQLARRNSNAGSGKDYKRRSGMAPKPSSKQSFDTKSDLSVASNTTTDSITSTKSVPVQTNFPWANKRQTKQLDILTRLHNHTASRSSQKSLEPSPTMQDSESDSQENDAKRPTHRERSHSLRPGSFDSSEMYDMPEFSEVSYFSFS